ncbi:iron chelate uptake ABC transporter family permease subunit [Bacillus sp. FJAT-50079]|uniref:FecCD family ABC transporter permease n=1 Tax=Bacillus sp. FJAT-50079 TaxID=2833577 RepID=UPI001BC948FE|nr:iron chelate uptake ABC transporter family permease subunit [Bacillus sp. FJAT-50079]MBS4209504.1 iron chelate uptake ABC transporter family permease subunit [Bacillus sp. FJAT-50079]
MNIITSVRLQRMIGFLVLLILLSAAVLLSLMIGAKPLPIGVVWDALFAPTNSYDDTIIQNSRIPRTLIALAVGPAFGLAGALIQALTRNPLADPGILGVNAGAAFAVALAVGIFSVTTMSGYVWFALLGAFVATIAVYVISGGAGKKTPTPVQITLAGVALGAALSGITTALTLMNSGAFTRMLNWNVGTLARRSLDDLWSVLPILVVGALLAFVAAPALNAIAYGDDRASSLGVNVGTTRTISLLSITLLAGGGTALAGPIGFIGLMVPHCVRWFIGPDQPWIFLYSLVAAPILLILSDIIGRVVLAPTEVPVGIITGLIGAPILLILVRRRKVSGL